MENGPVEDVAWGYAIVMLIYHRVRSTSPIKLGKDTITLVFVLLTTTYFLQTTNYIYYIYTRMILITSPSR